MVAGANTGDGDLKFDRIAIRPSARQVLVDGLPVGVGARAFDLLLALVQRRDRVVGKDELLALVWPGLVVEDNNLQVHVSALRKLLGPQAITTVPGRGYRFTAIAVAAPPPAAPPPLPPLYGRAADLLALAELIAAQRLVSVVGPGGVGKSTLVSHLTPGLADRYADGVVTVDLAPLAKPAQLIPAVAGALRLTLGGGAALSALAGQLSERDMLLVLENCEHVLLPVAGLTALLLRGAPRLRVLVTSQEALKLHDEQVYRLAPLALPEAGTLATLGEAREAGAVQLFEHRARTADARFALTAINVAAIVAICRQLDGNALAIELAAARVPLLGVEGVRQRLGERLRLLSGGARDLPARHRTLRAALQWSHGLLTPVQQVAFRRIGVMAGSFDIEAAQPVAGGGEIDPWEVLDALGALVDKSLVTPEAGPTGMPRFRLLETMRHLALENLAAAGEEPATRERHLLHYLTLAEAARAPLEGPQQGAWLARLDPDRDNLFAAHSACDHAPDGTARGLRLVSSLMRFWLSRGLLVQGQLMAEQALARPGADELGPLTARGLIMLGRLSAYRGLDREAAQVLARALDVARACQATALLVEALARRGYALLDQGDREGARVQMEEAYALCLSHPEARGVHDLVATQLAELERLEGRLALAERLYLEALQLARDAGDRLATMINLNNLAMVAVATGDVPTARLRLLESLAISDELDSRRGRLVVMEVCAGLAAQLDQWALAARLDAAADVHTVQMGRRRNAPDAAFLAPLLALAGERLGPQALAAARAAGTALGYEQAVAEQLRFLQG